MQDTSTPLKHPYKQNNIRRRIVRANLHQEHAKTPLKNSPPPPSQPVRLIGNPSIFAQQLPNINKPPQLNSKPPASIKSSEPYRRLLNQIDKLQEDHQRQLIELKQDEAALTEELRDQSGQLYNIRMEIWQLRNDIMSFRGELTQQEGEYQRLTGRNPNDPSQNNSSPSEQQQNSRAGSQGQLHQNQP